MLLSNAYDMIILQAFSATGGTLVHDFSTYGSRVMDFFNPFAGADGYIRPDVVNFFKK